MNAHSNVFQLPVQQAEKPVEAKRGPQVEDGYTRIANELFEAVTNAQTCPITLRQMRVVLAVIRKTYGFNKKADRISDGQIAAETGLSRQNVNKAKRELLAMNVLFMDGHKIGVNKAYEEWDFTAQPEKDNLKQTRDSVSKVETKSVSKSGSHKRQKDNLLPKGSNDTSKKSSPKKWGEPVDHELVNEMVAAVSSDLDAPVKHNATTWANDFRLMRTADGRTTEQIRYLIAWAAKHEFWSGVIMSPKKLRDKWDQLAKQAKAQHQQRAAGRQTPGRHSDLQAPDTSALVAKGDGTYEF